MYQMHLNYLVSKRKAVAMLDISVSQIRNTVTFVVDKQSIYTTKAKG